jgi:hypothetical protein
VELRRIVHTGYVPLGPSASLEARGFALRACAGPPKVQHGGVGESDTPRDISRLTVPEAARQLGISPEAVRNRLSRGTLRSVKESGTVYMLLEADRTRHNADIPDNIPSDMPQALVGEMRSRIESLDTS